MKKKFVVNLALLLFLNLLVKPFWIFGIDRTIQNVVGAENYGFYFSLLNFSFLFNIVLDLGITNFNNRNISQHRQLLSKHFSNIIVAKFLLAALYFIFSLLAAIILQYERRQIHLLLFLIFNQFLLSFILYLRSNLAGLHLFKTDSLISVLDRLLLIIICSILLWSNWFDVKFKIEYLVYSQTFAYLSTACITFFIVLAKSEFLKLRFDKTFLIVIIKKSFPFALLSLLQMFYSRIDSVMLERILTDGKTQAGIYAQSFRILDAVSMFSFLFASLLLPIFSKMLKDKSPVNQLTEFAFLLLIIPALIFAISTSFYSKEIMNILYHHHIQESARIYQILILGFVCISSSYIFGTLLTANGNMRALNIMATAGFGINILLNFVLIPYYQAYGAALASIATQLATALAQAIIAKRVFKFQISANLSILMSVFVLIFIGTGIFLFNSTTNWILEWCLLVISGFSLAFAFKLLDLRAIYELLRYGDFE